MMTLVFGYFSLKASGIDALTSSLDGHIGRVQNLKKNVTEPANHESCNGATVTVKKPSKVNI